MPMSITSHASSSSFFIAAAAEPRLENDRDAQKNPALDSLLNVDQNVAAVPDEIHNREYCGEAAGIRTDATGEVCGERIFSQEEISRHRREDDAWIVVDGRVYDVTQFLEIHPGGAELILDYLASEGSAKDAGLLIRGKVDEDGHSHSKAAFKMLEQFMVGSVEEQPAGFAPVKSGLNAGKKKHRYDVDLTKPIVCQVGYLGEDYDEWVHDPVISHDIPRFFQNDFQERVQRSLSYHLERTGLFIPFGIIAPTDRLYKRRITYELVTTSSQVTPVASLDYVPSSIAINQKFPMCEVPLDIVASFQHHADIMFFTRTKWWVVPLVWVPVALAMIYTAIVKENVPLSRMPVLVAGGILLWSSMEYLLHRFLFHMKTSSFWGNTLHYVLHGFHHKHPMDGSRLVFPPLFAAPICMLIWIGLGSWAADYPNKLVVYAVGLICYVIYDVAHYFLHFGTAFNDYTRQMKRYHLNHHFKDQTMGFGITSTVWDKVFRTQPVSKPSMD